MAIGRFYDSRAFNDFIILAYCQIMQYSARMNFSFLFWPFSYNLTKKYVRILDFPENIKATLLLEPVPWRACVVEVDPCLRCAASGYC